MTRLVGLWAILGAVVSATVCAEVASVEVQTRQVILDGKRFGDIGPYEKLSGRIYFSIDPTNRANRRISDIDLAPRDVRGLVNASANFTVLRPKKISKGTSVGLLEVSNRGGKAALRYFNAGGRFRGEPAVAEDFGDGLLMRLGYTIVWVGWQFDVPDESGNLRITVPVATQKGAPIVGLVRSDWVVDTASTTLPLAHRNHRAYPVSSPSDPRNVLTRRPGRDARRTVVARDRWEFAYPKDASGAAGPTAVRMRDGFTPGYIYELVYVSENPRVVGLGLAAVRDMMAYMKYGDGDLFPVTHGVAFGVSQTGRFLRHFLYQGFNVDESGRRVFDGMLIHTAGAGRGSFNHRFAQPSRDGHRYSAFVYPTDLFPFTSMVQKDPVTGLRGGLFSAYEDLELLPRLFVTNTSYEYWGRAASLIHTTVDGTRDTPLWDGERLYVFSGSQHYVDQWPVDGGNRLPGSAVWRGNPTDFLVNLRALLPRLVDWVVDDREPPESRYPTVDAGTLVPVEELNFPSVPGLTPPAVVHTAYRLDYGPRWSEEHVITRQPPSVGPAFNSLVPQVDVFGHDIAGVRNVELEAPLATYTGWSLRHGLPNAREIQNFRGCIAPLPATSAEARRRGDSRPSIESLYTDRDDYLKKARRAADDLVQKGFLLEEDVPRVMKRAIHTWDWIHPEAVPGDT